MSLITVAVPTLNEADRLPLLIEQLHRQNEPFELIIADGGSSDETLRIAERSGARVLVGARGRGPQLAQAAQIARGDIVLFLHADSVLPDGALSALRRRLTAEPGLIGGNFRLLFDGGDPFSRWLNRFYAFLRRRGLFYGDSGIFIRRNVLNAIGGIRPLALMEDFDLARRMKAAGPVCCIDEPALVTSSRRFRNRHPARIVAGWVWIHLLFSLGVGSDRLASFYDSTRQRRPDRTRRSAPSHRHIQSL